MSEYDDTHETPLEPAEHVGRDPDALTASRELGAVLETAIDTLPIRFRTVFMLRGVEQMSIAEVADVLGIPPATVKTRYHRAKAMLRDQLYRKLDMAAPRAFEFAGARCDRVTAAVMQRLRADR